MHLSLVKNKRLLSKALTKISLVLLAALMSTEAICQIRFLDIWEYRVEGNTLLPKDLVARILDPYLGVARKVDDTYKAAKALEVAYRNNGFPTVYVSVPDQDVVDGVVKLEVTEAKVRRVTIAGSRYFTLSGIRATVPSLKEGEVLHVPSLQSDLQRANQKNRDLKVVPVITQGPTEESIDVELSVADEAPLHGGISVSNYNTESTTPTRLSMELSYGNLWQADHEFGLQAQTSPENEEEVKVLAASYTMPISDKGAKLAMYAVSSDSEIAAVTDVNVLGEGAIFGVRYVDPFLQSGRAVHSYSVGFDYKDFDENLLLKDDTSLKTPISYMSWSALYNYYGQKDMLITAFNTGVTFGVRDVFNDGGEFNEKRSEATPNFALFNADLTQTWTLPASWKLRCRLRGQLSDSPLVSNEQFSAGGVATVRGYYEAQIQGDYGGIANLEIETPNFADGWPGFNGMSLLWFYDAARLRVRDPAADQEDDFKVESSGFALKLQMLDVIKVNVSSGYALREAGLIEEGNVRTRARLSVEF